MSLQLNVWIRGNKIITHAEWRVPATEDGVLTDPATIVFTLRETQQATGTTYAYPAAAEITRISTGIYELAIAHDTPGTFHVHAQGTGPAHGAGKITYKITESEALEVIP
jgi:hypothetical protein